MQIHAELEDRKRPIYFCSLINLNQKCRGLTETEMQPQCTCETAQIIPDFSVVVVLDRQKSLRHDEARQTKRRTKRAKKKNDLAIDKLGQPSHDPGTDTKWCSMSFKNVAGY